ncbi:MAG: ABC transporter ATP-binding protein [Pirellulaceae bacterium]|nr:MAG: ABC transporter ATP-binding protein [Pirellulaceae bacterium]
MIVFEHVTKLYGTVIGLNDVSLDLPPGTYGLLGPNGAGKTTLLNLLCGQLRPTLGKVRLWGEPPWRNRALFRRVGVCPSQELLHRQVTGLEWVAFLCRLAGFDASEAARRAEQALERVGMAHKMRHPIGSYSKGMRQRTKLAQALAHDPELLVLDEPFDGLDPIGRYELTQLLKQWGKDRSLILASHILHEVEAVCGSFLLIHGARLLAEGTAEQIQQLLAEIPTELTVSCSDPMRLAAWCCQHELAVGVRREGQDRLRLTTQRPAELAIELPRWASENGVAIYELTPPGDTLQTLFNSLIRLYRGEVP